MVLYITVVDSFGNLINASTGITSAGVYLNSDDSIVTTTYTVVGKSIITFTLSDSLVNNIYVKINGTKVLNNISVVGKDHVHTSATISDFSTAVDARITAQKGAVSGICPLGSDSLISSVYLPAIAITDTFAVASQSAMLALTAEKGDVAVRSDLSKSYILSTNSPSVLADWKELLTPTDTVLSVNSLTGAVTLTQDNIGDGTTYKQYSATEKTKLGNITLANTFATSGSYTLTLTQTGNTSVTLPTSGTLVSTTGTATLSNKTLTAPKFADNGYIADSNSNELIKFSLTASAVNEITIKNNATTYSPQIQASGGDTNIDLQLIAKGTGKVKVGSNGYEIADENNAITMANKTLTAPKLVNGGFIADSNGNELLKFTVVGSAVNEISITNNTITNAPRLSATGDDTNISLNLVPKGSGVVQANGVEIITLSGSQTLTNKTLTAPVITGSSAPTGSEGKMYFNSTTKKLMLYNGTAWVEL